MAKIVYYMDNGEPVETQLHTTDEDFITNDLDSSKIAWNLFFEELQETLNTKL